LPASRITLSVQGQGYYTLKAGGLESESITRSCPQAGDCGATDFEVARAAVVEGWLTDAFGDPLQDVSLALTPDSAPESADPMERFRAMAGRDESDDRGYFRIWGLRPGRYRLTATQRTMGPPGGQMAEETRLIEIAPGQTEVETRFSLSGSNVDVFSVSGSVSGVKGGEQGRLGIAVQPAFEDSNGFGWMRFETLHDGKFRIGGLQKGRYVLRLGDFAQGVRKLTYLETLSIDHDLTDVVLSPKPPTGIRGRVEFVEAPAVYLVLSAGPAGRAQFGRDPIEVKPPDYTFEHTGMPPGEYELVTPGGNYYLVDRVTFTVAVGAVREITVKVSNQRSAVRGSVRLAGGADRQAAANFTVGLRGDRGRHKVRADDSGGFVFEKLIPGDYEIAAWEALDVNVEDEDAWRGAGENVKRLVVEPGFETEVDLTVTP
jgi:hypothetical protein